MLITKLTGETIPGFDTKVVEFIETNKFNDPDKHAMVIGIDNSKGKLYRTIEVTGADDYVSVIDLLEEMNLVDVLSFGARVCHKGCDNRYRINGLNVNGLVTIRTQG